MFITKERLVPFLLAFCLVLAGTTPAAAQTKEAATKNFLQVLNQVLREGIQNRQAHQDSTTILSPFTINQKGILSVTLRLHNIEGGYTLKKEVPVADILYVVHDIYVVLECQPNAVKLYRSEKNNSPLKLTDTYHLLHVAYADDHSELPAKVEDCLRAVKKYYRKKTK